jgi:RNA polymerase sigma factor (sigma-70 family)
MTQEEATELVSSLFDSWYAMLVRYAYHLTNHTALAQDAVQDSFMHLYRALELGREIHNPKAWMLCVVRREIGKQQRNYGSREVSLDAHNLAGPWTDQPDRSLEYDDVVKILSQLSPREQEVILLRMESLKCREIADELGISINSVTTLLARALRRLTQTVILPSHSASAGEEVRRRVQKALCVQKTLY